ncbi:hypothetical protein DFH06DRAFT_423991 [Mycena polygramma]|nr:hypothetical protein DFH06DRAFT_423991 [Mycena polygramma]
MPEESDRPRNTWFSRLTPASRANMHRLLRTSEDETNGMSSMKWEDFLQLMRGMGFESDPSTAGSSVQFHPPNPQDVSITFHKRTLSTRFLSFHPDGVSHFSPSRPHYPPRDVEGVCKETEEELRLE